MYSERYQLLLDVDVAIEPIDRVWAARSWANLIKPDPEGRSLTVTRADFIARQDRLLEALLRDDETLDAWLRHEASHAVVDGGDIDLFDTRILAHELLAPVIPALAPVDRAWFGENVDNNRFYHSLETFFDVSTAEPLFIRIEHVPRPGNRDPAHLVDERYRIAVEVEARIGEIETAAAERDLARITKRDGTDHGMTLLDYIERQQRLVATLISNDDALDAWLRNTIFHQMADEGIPSGGPRPYWNILTPVVDRLSSDDRAYFENAVSNGMVSEAFEPFLEATTSESVSLATVRQPRQRRHPAGGLPGYGS
jgi:hypothetical protein